MPDPTPEQFATVCAAYRRYVGELRAFAATMEAVGVRVRNVEPFANFAEVIAAHEFGGEIQPPANKGYDLKTASGLKIQVKSLRISREAPGANGLDWRACTRHYTFEGRKVIWGDRIDADRLAIVVFLDFQPHALLDFPIDDRDTFPVLNRHGLGFSHVTRFLTGNLRTEGTGVNVLDLQTRADLNLPASPLSTVESP